jgi:hypothetical protein
MIAALNSPGDIMQSNLIQALPTLRDLPISLPREGAINIEFEQGLPILRIARTGQERIESLLQKQREFSLTPNEEFELQKYEEVDDYLSYLNRLIRNPAFAQQPV